jgi:hypothetical protein
MIKFKEAGLMEVQSWSRERRMKKCKKRSESIKEDREVSGEKANRSWGHPGFWLLPFF